MFPNYKVLIVDDDQIVLHVCSAILSAEGLEVHSVSTGRAALQMLAQNKFDLALLDIDLPDVDGLTLLEHITSQYAQISPVMMTGFATLEAAIRAQELSAEGFILKPFDDQKLLQIIYRVIERRQLREEHARLQALVQTEKLAALGRLTASLAHEINNPLQALRSGLRLLSRPQLDEVKRQNYVATLVKEVERLISITTQTLDFARPNRVGQRPADLNRLLQETITLVNKQLQHHHIEIIFNLAADLPPVEVVSDQLKQVFLNLILNSIDAMPEGGQLTLATSCCVTGAEVGLPSHASIKDDRFAGIFFEDTGGGMEAEVIGKIFEPFFSTKEAGTGLGLSVSYSIVEAHGGRIQVRSTPGQGSCFTIYLPLEANTNPNDETSESLYNFSG